MVDMDKRAEATKDYLAKDQWGKKEKPMTDKEKRQREEVIKITNQVLTEGREKYRHVQWNTEPPNLTELKEIIKKFKKGKAPGPDGITTDFLKDLNDEALEEIRKMVAKWWKSKEIPNNITLARVVSLYKKGDPEKQENYRPISLLNSFYKIVAAAIQRRLAGSLDTLLMKTQYGFRKNRSTADGLFVAKRMQEYAERSGGKGLMILLELGKGI